MILPEEAQLFKSSYAYCLWRLSASIIYRVSAGLGKQELIRYQDLLLQPFGTIGYIQFTIRNVSNFILICFFSFGKSLPFPNYSTDSKKAHLVSRVDYMTR